MAALGDMQGMVVADVGAGTGEREAEGVMRACT
jgi:precorrin-6B methylase 2